MAHTETPEVHMLQVTMILVLLKQNNCVSEQM